MSEETIELIWEGTRQSYMEEIEENEDYDGYFMDAVHSSIAELPNDGEFQLVLVRKEKP
jgi:hypothetical protein